MRTTPDSQQVPITISGGSTFGRYQKISSAQTYNMFLTDGWLCNTAGYCKVAGFFAETIESEGRLIYHSVLGNFILVVVNADVYILNEVFHPTWIGQTTTSTGAVFAAENLNKQICIVDGVNAYIYNYSLGANWTTQSLPFAPTYVQYQNSYFLFGTNTSIWYVYQYDVNNAFLIVQTTPGGQFTIQTKPDTALAVIRLPEQASNVLVMGSTVSEIWTQIGGIQNYRRNNSINVDYGVVSVSTIASSDEFVAWLAQNESNLPVIMVANRKGEFQRISTDGIDYLLSTVAYPKESAGMIYRQDGHLFYQLTFYNYIDNLTLLYDFTTQMFFNLSDCNLNYHPACGYAYFNGELYFASLNNSNIYQSSTAYTTYNENLLNYGYQDLNLNFVIPRIRICDTISLPNSAQFRTNSVSFTLEQGTDPNYTMAQLEANTPTYIITEQASFPSNAMICLEGTNIPIALEVSELGVAPMFRDFTGVASYQPKIGLTVSRDGGITWSNEVYRVLNTEGDRQNILNWEGLGSANYLTLKFRFYGMSKFVCSGGYAELH
jgi:hypothetical protein